MKSNERIVKSINLCSSGSIFENLAQLHQYRDLLLYSNKHSYMLSFICNTQSFAVYLFFFIFKYHSSTYRFLISFYISFKHN